MPMTGTIPPSATGKVAGSLIAGLLVGAVVGYGAGRVSVGSPVNPLFSKSGSYQDGYNAAIKKLHDSGLIPAFPTSASSLSGTISAVGENSLTLEINLPFNPLEELNAPKERTVTVTSATKIYKQNQKPPDQFQKELSDFQKAAVTDHTATPPSPFTRSEASLKDLKKGDSVTVIAATDILFQKSFTAKEIDLSSLPFNAPTPVVNTPPSPAAAQQPQQQPPSRPTP